MSIIYALRAEYRHDRFGGGVLAVGTSTFDVLAELEKGGGHIVVDDHNHALQSVLDGYRPLERVLQTRAEIGDRLPEGAPLVGVEQPTDGELRDVPDRFDEIEDLAELRRIAKDEFGIEHPGRSRDDVLTALRAANTDNDTEA